MIVGPSGNTGGLPHYHGQDIDPFLFGVRLVRSVPSIQSADHSNPKTEAASRVVQLANKPSLARIGKERTLNKKTAIACVKAIDELTSEEPDFTKFNRIADGFKTHHNWELILHSAVSNLNNEQLMRLVRAKHFEFRGYDRQSLKVLLSAAKGFVESRELATKLELDEFNRLIESLDTLSITVDESEMTLLGGGAVNKVYMIKYIDPITNDKMEAVFKPDPADLDAMTKIKEAHFGTAAASGIPPGAEGHLPSRAVASSIIDQLLYGEDSVSVKTQFVYVNGRRGILMQKAQGASPKPTDDMLEEQINLNAQPYLRMKILNELESQGEVNPLTLLMVAASKQYERVKLIGNAEKFELLGYRREVENLDPTNPETVDGLIRLQIKDIITGECDRHPENYFINSEGKVTGIDEDCCFGVNALPEGDVRAQEPIVIVPGIAEIPNNASLMLRMPPVVTKKMYDQVIALRKSPDLPNLLYLHVNFDEAAATFSRISRLIEHMESYHCRIVETKEELVADYAMMQYDSNNSLLIREMFVHREKGEKGWNHLRAYRTK